MAEDKSIFAGDGEGAEEIAARMVASYEKAAGRVLYPGDPYRLFLLWLADVISQFYVYVNRRAESNLPRYARGKDLEALVDMLWGEKKLPAAPARTTIRFTLSEARPGAVAVPKGTRAAAGELRFETVAEAQVPAGELYVDAAASCVNTGGAGNGLLPGQISSIVDFFPYLAKVENVTATDGGADEESDASFYERVKSGFEAYSTAGPMGAYEYLARSASALILDAKADSPAPGEVVVRILLKGGGQPSDEMKALVMDKVSADKARPLTDSVSVEGPGQIGFAIDFTYYLRSGEGVDAAAAEAAVNKAVDDYVAWQTGAMGRDVNPTELYWRLRLAGVKRLDVRQPVYAEVGRNEAAGMSGDAVAVNGGYEDE